MNKREFLKKAAWSVSGLAAAQMAPDSFLNFMDTSEHSFQKNWIWMTPDTKTSDDEWKRRLEQIKMAGIDAILPEVFQGSKAFYGSSHLPVEAEWLEQLIPLAKAAGLEIHAWMWTMPCLIPAIQQAHPEWYNVNGKGESSVDKPAYVNYYKFLCPSREPVHAFIQKRVRELAAYDIDGIHFDYVRHPDVILASSLQPKYGIVQDREYPEYDYCYCDHCRAQFQAEGGTDPLKMEDPSASKEWLQFRYDLITNLVNNKLIPIVKESGKIASAAVFPNWKHVRQEWRNWKLDAALPMLYHSFYEEDLKWIRKHVKSEIRESQHNTSIYSGLFVPALSPAELAQAIKQSKKGKAKGISLFAYGSMKEAHWKVLAGNSK